MFGLKRRGVRRCENDTLLPKPGPLPHTSQTEATGLLQFGRLLDSCWQARARQSSKDIRRTRRHATRLGVRAATESLLTSGEPILAGVRATALLQTAAVSQTAVSQTAV